MNYATQYKNGRILDCIMAQRISADYHKRRQEAIDNIAKGCSSIGTIVYCSDMSAWWAKRAMSILFEQIGK